MERLKVVLLPIPALFEPWCTDVIDAIGARHDLVVYAPERAMAPQLSDADVVIDHGGSASTLELMDAAVNVRLWEVLGTGYDHFDLETMRRKGVPVTNCPGQFSATALAETAMMFMLMVASRYKQRAAGFERGTLYGPLGSELGAAHLLIIGYGASGQELARRARAFGMQISAIDVRPLDLAEDVRPDYLGTPADVDRLLAACDYVSLHLHLNDDTRHFLGERRLALLRPTACVINVARGALVDEEALYDALVAGRLGGAGLDAFVQEPPDPKLPVYGLPNVVTTPHTAGVTRRTSQLRAACVAQNVDRLARGQEPLYRID